MNNFNEKILDIIFNILLFQNKVFKKKLNEI